MTREKETSTSNFTLRECVLLFLFIDAVLILLVVLKYNIGLPYSYLTIFVVIYVLILISILAKYSRLFPMIAVLYAIAIVSVFAIRFGVFAGDSITDLSAIQQIMRAGLVNYSYHTDFGVFSQFPLIHIIGASLGLITGLNDVNVYIVATYLPTVFSIISALFIYLLVNRLFHDSRYSLLMSMVWISLPFVSRWMIQTTRTTAAIPLLIMIFYLIIIRVRNVYFVPITITVLIIITANTITHPIASAFVVLALVFIVIYQAAFKNRRSMPFNSIQTTQNTSYLLLAVISVIILLGYWIYYTTMHYAVLGVIESIIYSFTNFLTKSTVGELALGTAGSSYSIAPLWSKLLGMGRVLVFVITAFIGIIFLIRKYGVKTITIPLSIYGVFFMGLVLGIYPSSTTSYRAALYSSALLIIPMGYFCYRLFRGTLWQRAVTSLILVILILPAPFYTGEVVLLSDWLYHSQPLAYVDYERGEVQRFTEHYHIDVPLWIRKYTPADSLIWADPTYSYHFMVGYSNRKTLGNANVMPAEGVDIPGLQREGYNFVLLNDQVRRTLMWPYGIPPYYLSYNFQALDTSTSSYRVYDSGDAQVYWIPE
jgi:hypothetical protein